MKQIGRLLTVAAGFAAMVFLCAICAGADTYGDYTYSVQSDGTVRIDGYEGTQTTVSIPSAINGKAVSAIGEYAFSGTDVVSVTVPDGVLTIDSGAFAYCDELKNAALPSGLKAVSSDLFYNCKKLQSVTIPSAATYIGSYAFANCEMLTTVSVPSGVTEIGYNVFMGTKALVSIDVAAANEYFCTVGGVLYSADKTTLYAYPAAKTGDSYSVLSTVTRIDDGAFSYSKYLKTVSMGDSVTVIGSSVFEGCDLLAEVALSASIKEIPEAAFAYCGNLTTVSIPEGVTKIGYDAFYCCGSLERITLPSGVTTIGGYAFSNCESLLCVTVPDTVSSIAVTTFKAHSDNFVINCNENSYAQKYAINNGIAYTLYPGVVSGFAADAVALDSVSLSWEKNPDAKGYILEKYSGGKWSQIAFIINNETVTFSVNGLAPSTAYKFKAAAYAVKSGVIIRGAESVIAVTTTPCAVTGFSLGGRASNALRLNWEKNDSADGYIIEQNINGKWTRISKITTNKTTTLRVENLQAGTAYKFRMRAYKITGTSSAVYSAYTSTIAARTNPSAVKGFALGGRASNALRLNWTANSSADGYIIEQYISGKWTRIAKLTDNETATYRVEGLSPSTACKFRIKAYKMSGSTALYSGYSDSISATTNPAAVTGFSIGGKATTALRLNWKTNDSVDGYIIEIYKNGKWTRTAKIKSSETTTYRVTGLTPGTEYQFRIKGYNMVGSTALYSSYSTISATTNS